MEIRDSRFFGDSARQIYVTEDGTWGRTTFMQILDPYELHIDEESGIHSGKLYIWELDPEVEELNASFTIEKNEQVTWFDELGEPIQSPLNTLEDEVEVLRSLFNRNRSRWFN